MVPVTAAVIEAVPRNRNGQVDRTAMAAETERRSAEPDLTRLFASSMRAIFEYPTARGLAEHLREVAAGPDVPRIQLLVGSAPGGDHSAEAGEESGPSFEIIRVLGSGPRPGSFAQRRLLVADRHSYLSMSWRCARRPVAIPHSPTS